MGYPLFSINAKFQRKAFSTLQKKLKFSKLACQNAMEMLQATFLHLQINSGELQPHVIKIIHQVMQVVCAVLWKAPVHFAGPCITQHSHATRSYCNLEEQDGETGAEEGVPQQGSLLQNGALFLHRHREKACTLSALPSHQLSPCCRRHIPAGSRP